MSLENCLLSLLMLKLVYGYDYFNTAWYNINTNTFAGD